MNVHLLTVFVLVVHTDIDECTSDNCKCVTPQNGGLCKNLAGIFSCGCLAGYEGDGLINGDGCTGEMLTH